MGKVYILLGYFLLGVALAGFVSYSAYLFPSLRAWGIALIIVSIIVFISISILDDFISSYIGIPYHVYVGVLIFAAMILIVGGVIQWL